MVEGTGDNSLIRKVEIRYKKVKKGEKEKRDLRGKNRQIKQPTDYNKYTLIVFYVDLLRIHIRTLTTKNRIRIYISGGAFEGFNKKLRNKS